MSGIRKRFGATPALDGVGFEVRAGEIHALVGENGAGKSTLMKILSGAEKPDEGEILLDGEHFSPADPLAARRAGVAMIYQELSLAGHLTVEENISLGVETSVAGVVRRRGARAGAAEALAQLGHPEIPLDRPVRFLPIGARQVVEVARAMVSGCGVLILDEPTSSLGRKDVGRLFGLLRRLKARGHAIVYISHFLEEVKEVADRFTVLRDGLAVGSGEAGSATAEQIAGMMVGRRIERLYPRSKRVSGEAVMTVDGLAGVAKPSSAGFELSRGEVFGIAGLVGAGRTELLRTLFGLERASRGTVRVGAFSGAATPHQRLAQGVGLLSEDRKGEGLALSLSVADNLTLSRMSGMGPAGCVLPSRQHATAGRWVRRLDVRCRSTRQQARDLSGGNQQKLALARLLYHDVDVLLLDEPTRGVDVASKAQIYRLIDALARGAVGQRPKAVLMVSSYLPELLGICDRVAVMTRGVLGPARPAGEWTEHELLLAATGQETA